MIRDPDATHALVGVHVIVVDHSPEGRELLQAVLTYCGASVTPAATAREALEALEHLRIKPVDVVVTDLMLPGEDGYWLVREIGGRVPAIALATRPGHGPDRTIAAGFQGHLRKPVDPWELCRLVAELVRKP